MIKIIYINGTFSTVSEARISPFNRGLLYGDGFFETMKGYHGKIFALNAHYERLNSTARFLRMSVPFGVDELRGILTQLLERNALTGKDSRIRMTLTRGEGTKGLFPDETAGTEVIISADAVPEDIRNIQMKGISLSVINHVAIDQRSPLVCHKTLNYMPGILGLMEVRERGGDEGLFLNYDGNVAEGTTSNIFAVRREVIITPPLSAGILAGITRGIAIRVALRLGIKVEERDVTLKDLFDAEELFITSSVREIVPVVSLEGKACAAGPVTRRMQEGYKGLVREVLEREGEEGW